MTVMDSLAEISSEAELRELLETPMPRAITNAERPGSVEELERYYGPQYATRIYG
jgi:hypothetical protein